MKQVAIVISCAAIAAGGVVLGYMRCDWSALPRSGALVVVVAILSEYWVVLTTPSPDQMPFWTTTEGHTATRVAIVLMAIGTLMQGFGDLLAQPVLTCK
jgi:surface polysaccharide O-acyltransferase-like enzyme